MQAKYQGRVVFVRDVTAVARWLTQGLGLEIGSTDSEGDVSVLAPIDSGEGRVEFYLHPTDDNPGNQHLGTFLSPDCDAQAAEAVAMGCRLVREPENTPWGTRDIHLIDEHGIEFTLSTAVRSQ